MNRIMNLGYAYDDHDGKEPYPETDDPVLELAQRVCGGRARLLVREVDPEVGDRVPIPPDARVIGSLVIRPMISTVIFETSLSPDEVKNYYKKEMIAMGWSEPEPWPSFGSGGFRGSSHRFMEGATDPVYCGGPKGPELRLGIAQPKGRPTEVRLNLNFDEERSECARRSKLRSRMEMRSLLDLLPIVEPPAGSLQMPVSASSSNNDYVEAASYLKSSTDFPVLLAHYRGQFSQLGWRAVGSGESGQFAWSAYTFKDEDSENWDGLFLILGLPGRNDQYNLILQVAKEDRLERFLQKYSRL